MSQAEAEILEYAAPEGALQNVQPAAEMPAQAIDRGRVPWEGHPLNIRLSIPFVFGRYYLVVLGGRERRSPERLVQERRKHPLLTLVNVIAMGALGTLCGLALLAALHLFTLWLYGDVILN